MITISQPEVYLRNQLASDDDVIEAMLVSTAGDEIKQLWPCARACEAAFAAAMPVTYQRWNENGRVAP